MQSGAGGVGITLGPLLPAHLGPASGLIFFNLGRHLSPAWRLVLWGTAVADVPF